MPRLVLPGVASDPNVFPRQPDRDYVAVADTAYYTALGWSNDVAGDDLALADVADQMRACREWFATHDQHDSDWQRAGERKREIEDTETAIRITRRMHAYACWIACCEVYAACSHLAPLERQSWLLDHAPGMGVEHPNDVWRWLRGDEPPPGSWPMNPTEAHIERRLGQSPTWEREELKVLAERKGLVS